MKKISVLLIILLSIGCRDTKKCENAICTEMFAMVTVKVSDTTNTNLQGITSQTILVSNGQVIHTHEGSSNLPNNNFVVADDSDLKELGFNNSQKVELKILKDGAVLKTIPFTIKTDCCHVSKSEGPEEVSLN